MDKTLADCWAFLQRHGPNAWHFAKAELILSDEPGLREPEHFIGPGNKLAIRMTADSLRCLARFVARPGAAS